VQLGGGHFPPANFTFLPDTAEMRLAALFIKWREIKRIISYKTNNRKRKMLENMEFQLDSLHAGSNQFDIFNHSIL
jgi:hypothetical protein